MKFDIQKNEIVYCDILILNNKSKIKIKNVVYKHLDGFFYRKRILNPLKIYKAVKVLEIKIHKRLGFSINNNSYIEVKKSDEKRNKTTGAYD